MGRCLVSVVDDGTAQEDPDRLIQCLVDDAYGVWVECDKMNLHIIHQIRSLPWAPCYSNVFKPPKKSILTGYEAMIGSCVI